MRVISFGIYSQRPEYPRQRNLVRSLEGEGVEVAECHCPVAADFRERMRSVSTPVGGLAYGARLLGSYFRLTRQFLRLPACDVVLVGHPGVFHVSLARWLARRSSSPPLVVLDVFFSLHGAVVGDRRLVGHDHWLARLLRAAEGRAVRGADLCLMDTRAHANALCEAYDLPPSKVAVVPVGPSFPPAEAPVPARSGGGEFHVVFVGTYIPLHGVEVILECAERLRGHPRVRFTLIGTGQLRAQMEERARTLALSNVTFRDWVPTGDLRATLRGADLALGIFGVTEKARRVVPIKVFDVCAAGVPLVTADTAAAQEILQDGESALLVPPGDAGALARAVLRVRDDPALRHRLAAGAHAVGTSAGRQEGLATILAAALGNRCGAGATSPP